MNTPPPVARALHKLGQDIRNARLRRHIPMAILAERASTTRTTLSKIEHGKPGVSLGIYATVLFTLGMIDRLADIADPRHDAVGLGLGLGLGLELGLGLGLEREEERLPKRIYPSRRTQTKVHKTPPTSD